MSHGSAAALWGIGREGGPIEVSVRRRCRHRRRGLKVRSRPSLPSQDITTYRGIPVTTPARTALDQAATSISDSDLERLVNEAAQKDRIHPEPLRRYAAGLVPLRFTHWQVAHDPRHIEQILCATLRLRLHPAGAAGAGSRAK